jgi:3-oxoacyl-[acyl-carrier-protein] synthase II
MSDVPRPSGRVVVTGLGAITPLGTGVDTFWPRMLRGESGIGRLTYVKAEDFTTQIGGEIHDFNAEDYLDRKEARRIDRFIAFAVAAANMALTDASLMGSMSEELKDQSGVLIGSGIGGLTFLSEQFKRLFEGGPGKVSPFLVPYMIPDMASGMVSITYGLRGPNTCAVSACSTGADAIGQAYHTIKRGDATIMVTGGCEAPLNDISVAGFCAARAMSTRNDDPQHASRPFERDRDGFVMAEGGAVLILEDYEHAKARGAKMYAEVVGYGASADAHHITMPDPEGRGATRSMQMAMRNAGITPDQIDYVNAHGTSTPYNDKFETMAIKKALGDHAYKTAVSSTKSMIGHTLGAAGALESLICILAIRDSMLPPTINYQNPDPECDLDYVPNVARAKQVRYALNNSFGFGGHNVSLVIKSMD